MSDIIVSPSGDSGTNGWIIATMLAVLIVGGVTIMNWENWTGRSGDTTVINVTTPPAAGARQTEINLDTPAAPVDPGIVILPAPEPERPSADVPVEPDPEIPAEPEPIMP